MTLTSRVYCQEQIEVPPELPQLIKKFTKEIIRYNAIQPDIVRFAKDFFTASVAGDLDNFLAACEAETLKLKHSSGQGQETIDIHPDALLMLQTVFNVLDTNLDAHISFDEIRRGIEGTPLGDNVLGYLSDIIGDKEITFQEFMGLFTNIHPDEVEDIRDQWLAKYYARVHTPAVVELYTTVFQVWDADNSGSISLQELVEAVKKADLDHPDIIPYLCSADVDNNGTISLQEFLCFMPHISDEDLPLMADRLLGAWMREEE